MLNVAILGFGARGNHYAHLVNNSGMGKIVAACDVRAERLELAKREFELSDTQLYQTSEDFFKAGKLADLCVVATQDAQHLEHAVKAMKLGYHLLLEKPIAANMQDVMEIYETSLKEKRRVFVCHVLRYAPFYSVIKDELSSGKYGKIVTINMSENVGYWHQAHSFVRGNWSVAEKSTPMIIAKCCHDLDLVSWFMDQKCKSVSSFGSLSYFRKENAPAGHTARCIGCPEQGKCAYDAEKIYITDRFNKGLKAWPVDVVAMDPTEEKLREALRTGPYGRCVFECDNTAVDHQVVNMVFEDGATAHLTMTAFSASTYRDIHVHCEKGDIYGNMESQKLNCNVYGFESRTIDIKEHYKSSYGHGGGDYFIVKDVVEELTGGNAKSVTSIERSVQSHKIGFAAEESRLQGGKVIEVDF